MDGILGARLGTVQLEVQIMGRRRGNCRRGDEQIEQGEQKPKRAAKIRRERKTEKHLEKDAKWDDEREEEETEEQQKEEQEEDVDDGMEWNGHGRGGGRGQRGRRQDEEGEGGSKAIGGNGRKWGWERLTAPTEGWTDGRTERHGTSRRHGTQLGQGRNGQQQTNFWQDGGISD
ncbi:hypothetical protein niasHT_000626 [Heterodera trifolii]|uniref:Uncharacterized protein n=1 Tax=Heterodera trifolii TaxID=157864 RepID=A0ABD2MC12_9BILA